MDSLEALNKIDALLRAGRIEEAQFETVNIDKEYKVISSCVFESVYRAAEAHGCLLQLYTAHCRYVYGPAAFERLANGQSPGDDQRQQDLFGAP